MRTKYMLIGIIIVALVLGGCRQSFDCKKCDGDGHYICVQCDGTGKHEGEKCVQCYGAGVFTCNICDGTGKVTEDDLPKVQTR